MGAGVNSYLIKDIINTGIRTIQESEEVRIKKLQTEQVHVHVRSQKPREVRFAFCRNLTEQNINSCDTQTHVQMDEKAVPCSTLQKALAFMLTSLWDYLKSGSSMKVYILLPVLPKYCETNLDLEQAGGKRPLDNLV